jgi:hypothetical protein
MSVRGTNLASRNISNLKGDKTIGSREEKYKTMEQTITTKMEHC